MQNSRHNHLSLNRPFSTAEAASMGISRQTLSLMHKRGLVERVSRGVYLHTDGVFSEHLTYQSVMLKVPSGVLCLLSALRYHGLTTQLPRKVWLAVKPHSHPPDMDTIQLKYVSVSEPSFSYGIEEHVIDGITIRVYSVAKTVADCFKFRNKIGLDVALEALREAIRYKKFTIDELMKAAEICRVTKSITPYVEILYL